MYSMDNSYVELHSTPSSIYNLQKSCLSLVKETKRHACNHNVFVLTEYVEDNQQCHIYDNIVSSNQVQSNMGNEKTTRASVQRFGLFVTNVQRYNTPLHHSTLKCDNILDWVYKAHTAVVQ